MIVAVRDDLKIATIRSKQENLVPRQINLEKL